MKDLIKKLLREYYDDFDLGFDEPQQFNFKSLPEVVTLYRILYFDNEDDIKNMNTAEPGSHYSMDRENLIKSRSFMPNKFYYILKVQAPKKLIDVEETIRINREYPMEKEITLKNKGKGAKIISATPLKK